MDVYYCRFYCDAYEFIMLQIGSIFFLLRNTKRNIYRNLLSVVYNQEILYQFLVINCYWHFLRDNTSTMNIDSSHEIVHIDIL